MELFTMEISFWVIKFMFTNFDKFTSELMKSRKEETKT